MIFRENIIESIVEDAVLASMKKDLLFYYLVDFLFIYNKGKIKDVK